MESSNPAPSTTAWPLVSVLFITYKRFDLLQQAVATFVEHTVYPNLELIIADDGSSPEMQQSIRDLPYEKTAILPAKNRGLGANINAGMAACHGKYILMIQDDWASRGPADALANTIALMEAHPEIGLVHYTMGLKPRPETVKISGFGPDAYLYPDNPDHREYHVIYSDQPHVRRSEVNDFLGPYLEHRDMHLCERDYEQRWDKQTRYKSAMFPAYWLTLFTNEGNEASIREEGFRYKSDRLLRPIALRLKRYPAVFTPLRNTWRAIQKLFRART